MSNITHRVCKSGIGGIEPIFVRITLPAMPGAEISKDRSETTPKELPIRYTKRRPTGAAVRKPSPYAVLRAVLVEIAEDQP